eukprot:CAMPEP_0179175762 /NCGR_PEP_ID=MMETSP0796-20121207/86826_1 /TAXON_ID=73915 /ORGANISM="Pyrodinium bahamense, Strain pbaha01" /LENGTH=30 /DNA_ID= /DNA_START= /DNA_END= /DNA_ORIENTATION=
MRSPEQAVGVNSPSMQAQHADNTSPTSADE